MMRFGARLAFISFVVMAGGYAAGVGCAGKAAPRGGLMLIVAQEGALALDRLHVDVNHRDASLLRRDYALPSEATLPTTLAIASNGDATAVIRIEVSAFRGGVPIDRRDAIVQQVPTDRVAALTVVLSARCTPQVYAEGDAARSRCAATETCDPGTGACVSAVVDASRLPTYEPGQESEAGVVGPVTTDDASTSDGGLESGPQSCGATEKRCGALCVSRLDPAKGCDAPSCAPCTVDPNAVAACNAAGACELTACKPGYKLCGKSCVSAEDPTFGCGAASCAPCPTPNGDGGTNASAICENSACALGDCAPGTKSCAGFCVTRDRNHGCEAASCTACTASETCQGAPSTCTCVPDNDTPCSGKACGPATNNCGAAITCTNSCAPPSACGDPDAGPNVCRCTAEPLATTCAGKACGPAVNNCGRTVVCPNTCAAGYTCGARARTNTCAPAPSCENGGVGKLDCGPTGDQSCCTSLPVPGATFLRDGTGPSATVSAFRLDKFEVTVGRFREFAEEYKFGATFIPPAGSGKHVHLYGGAGLSGVEPGWNSAWTLPASGGSVDPWAPRFTGCTGHSYNTGNDALPVNCVPFTAAFAFCIWDGGFLPSSAEWNLAATGGASQLPVPWGSGALDATRALYCPESGPCPALTNVGARASGNGPYGHADLIGSVAEWVADWAPAQGLLPTPCIDCAAFDDAGQRVFRGGSYLDKPSGGNLSLTKWSTASPIITGMMPSVGFRCARLP